MEQQTGATAGIVIWIERTYQRRGRRRSLGKLTPIEFETVLEVAHAA
jgi:putative transposase